MSDEKTVRDFAPGEMEALLEALKKYQRTLDAPKTVEQPKVIEAKPGLRLDLGCGTKKQPGFVGVDKVKFDGVDVVHDIALHTWPWSDGTVDEVYCSHTIEHLTWPQRVFFFNELYRVMKKDAEAKIILPHWCSNRYYGDPTHQAPFSEMAWFYLKKAWRKEQAPHVDAEMNPGPLSYSCDFETIWAYSMAPWLNGRSNDYITQALQMYKEAAQDMIGTLKKIG